MDATQIATSHSPKLPLLANRLSTERRSGKMTQSSIQPPRPLHISIMHLLPHRSGRPSRHSTEILRPTSIQAAITPAGAGVWLGAAIAHFGLRSFLVYTVPALALDCSTILQGCTLLQEQRSACTYLLAGRGITALACRSYIGQLVDRLGS